MILYTITKKCLKLSPQNLKSRKLNPQRVLLGQEMRPNIKFDLIGLKLAEISSFENQYFSVQKNALQADSVQGAKKNRALDSKTTSKLIKDGLELPQVIVRASGTSMDS